MAMTLALTADSKKTTLLNYCSVENLLKDKDEVIGVEFHDNINFKKYKFDFTLKRYKFWSKIKNLTGKYFDRKWPF